MREGSENWEERSAIAPAWQADWDRLTVFFGFIPEIRRVIYTTNAIESLNDSLGKVVKNRGAFPDDLSIQKVFFMALEHVSKKWTRPVKNWKAALNQFVILYDDRVPV